MFSLISASRSERGKVRETNEDSILETDRLFAVADGMGGHVAGEVASSLALEAVREYVDDNPGIPPEKLIRQAVAVANRVVFEKAHSDPHYRNMGTTVTALYMGDGEIFLGHVGDSRAYLFRDGELRQLTRDHSLVAKLVEDGEITSDEAKKHPQRNIILKALGVEEQLEADVFPVDFRPGDICLLATDGLTAMVSDNGIESAISEKSGLEAAADRLVEMALKAGGVDNISVVLVRIADPQEEGGPGPDEKTEQSRKGFWSFLSRSKRGGR